MLQLLAICVMGDVYIENRRGPNTDPCGTPDVQVVTTDEAWPSRTTCVRLVRYDVSQSRVVPEIPKLQCNRFRRRE